MVSFIKGGLAVSNYSKYRAKKTIVDGVTFASKRESKRYGQLKIMERAGLISDLRLQVKYPILVNGILICHYVADFTYTEKGKVVDEDSKGFKTPIYRLKKKLMMACYGIEILET